MVSILCFGACFTWAVAFTYPDPPEVTEKALSRHWIHAREEDRDGVHLYRAKGSFEPRPSRFRMEYDLQEQGKCRYMWLSPSDGHRLKDGTWKLRAPAKPGDNPIIEVREGNETRAYAVISLTKDTLRLKPEPQP